MLHCYWGQDFVKHRRLDRHVDSRQDARSKGRLTDSRSAVELRREDSLVTLPAF